MRQHRKFIEKEISTALRPLKTATEASHEGDLSAFVRVENLTGDDDSPIATPTDTKGKRKKDAVDNLDDKTLEVTRARLRPVEEQDIRIALHKSIIDNYPTSIPIEVVGASSSSASARVTLTLPLPLPVLEPVVVGAEIDASETTLP
ncbi:hypothetical protein K7X08_004441 [Anisodus acutangulus]|uniref:Uncharacterized protein n=1 Tax=Anisodus acutangulus TaxID=402998 RepID=A0A9Q1RHG0_9SOLA|nr:hypothetical protein K7X08_004441 [Anisodus acutangulus]